ncbi:MAG: winged helix-turn-helix domain-containing protein [Marmoricola sp.]
MSGSSMDKVSDPRILRAIAHPMRTRILGEIVAAGHLRAADVAATLDIPANQASFHLRQLAKYGLVELAPELARDGRDRVWRPVHEHGLSLDVEQMEKGEGGKATVTVWRKQAAAQAKDAVDTAYGARKDRDSHIMISDDWIRLTKAEAKELADDLLELQERWADRTRSGPPTKGERRTYHVLKVLQPAPEVEA